MFFFHFFYHVGLIQRICSIYIFKIHQILIIRPNQLLKLFISHHKKFGFTLNSDQESVISKLEFFILDLIFLFNLFVKIKVFFDHLVDLLVFASCRKRIRFTPKFRL